MSLLIVVV